MTEPTIAFQLQAQPDSDRIRVYLWGDFVSDVGPDDLPLVTLAFWAGQAKDPADFERSVTELNDRMNILKKGEPQ